jgi:GTP-binding protein HflX
VHVVDASNPRRDEQIAHVDTVLAEIGAHEIPQLLVYNKIDRLQEAPRVDRDAHGRATAVWISAEQGLGLDLLKGAVAERLARFARFARVRMPANAGALRSKLYAAQVVRSECAGDDGSMELSVELPDLELLTLARTAGVQILEVSGSGAPCAPGDLYLQSSALASATK